MRGEVTNDTKDPKSGTLYPVSYRQNKYYLI